MKNVLGVKRFFMLVSAAAGLGLTPAKAQVPACKDLSFLVAAEARAAEQKLDKKLHREATEGSRADVVYHRCMWNVDPAVRAIDGSVTTYFKPKEDLSYLRFDLNGMTVDSVFMHGNRISFGRTGMWLDIYPANVLAKNVLDSVRVYYHGIPVNSGFGSFVTSKHTGTPVMWTLSEPYGARDWWPCNNDVGEKIDSLDVFLTCPNAYKGVSNGLCTEVIENGAQTTFHWRHRYPITSYLVAFAVTNYDRFTDSVRLRSGNMLMETFCYPESRTEFEEGVPPTISAMQLFDSVYGAYPFAKEKYGHTQFSWGGGEEHQTNSFLISADQSLCAHELAHQWFGDKITCGSFSDIWLNEGFATFSASLFMERQVPSNVISTRKAEIDKITGNNGGSVYVADTSSVSRIFDNRLTYLKGSHVLYMLRLKIGEKAFYQAISNYLKDPKLAYAYAKTKDLQAHFEATSATRLDSFFRQWIYAEGFPSFKVEWAQIGPRTVKIKFDQTTSHSSVDYFQLPIPLRFRNANDTQTILVHNNFRGETVIRDIGFVADTVDFDPEYLLISRNNSVARRDELGEMTGNLLLYPNPATDQVQLRASDFPGQTLNITLHAANGALQFATGSDLYKGKTVVNINMQNLSTGVYYLSVIDANGKKTVHAIQKY